MPRASYVSSVSYRTGQQSHSPENESLDCCQDCYRRRLWVEYVPGALVGGEWVDEEVEHPDYDGEGYTCIACGRPLTAADN